MFKIRKKLEIMLLEKNEYKEFCFTLYKMQTVKPGMAKCDE